ncbi:MAG: nucleotidyltransferase family protein [Alphaproteobacteria bacterium]
MSAAPSKAMLMAAGLGLRMRPLSDLPKPMIPVDGIPLVDRALSWLEQYGIQEVVVNTHYRSDLMQGHLAVRTHPHITISHEDELLETGGGIVKALPLLGDEPFFAINSDVICIDGATPALAQMARQWNDAQMDALLLLQPVDHAVGYSGAGDFFMDDAGKLTRRGQNARAPYVFTGVQLLHPRLFTNVPPGRFSMNVLYDRLLQPGAPRSLYGLVHDGAWLHVGDPAGVSLAEQYLQQSAKKRVTQN